jgi:Domain of unknown function (DUF4389)
MPEAVPAYPASFVFDGPESIAHWRPLLNWLFAIPHYVVLYVLQLVSEVVTVISWFVILFTGKLPEGLAGYQAMYLRYALRTYSYSGFMREEYPPFTFATTPADPGDDPRVRVDLRPELIDRNRVTVFFRIILLIPQAIVLAVLSIMASLVLLVSFFAVLFTGRWPAGMRDFVVKFWGWWLRVTAYGMLLTDAYPPFSLG